MLQHSLLNRLNFSLYTMHPKITPITPNVMNTMSRDPSIVSDDHLMNPGDSTGARSRGMMGGRREGYVLFWKYLAKSSAPKGTFHGVTVLVVDLMAGLFMEWLPDDKVQPALQVMRDVPLCRVTFDETIPWEHSWRRSVAVATWMTT